MTRVPDLDQEDREATAPGGSLADAGGASGAGGAPAGPADPVAGAVRAPGRLGASGNAWVRPDDAPWTRPALAALLLITAVSYLWNLDRNGWGNSFYAAAVQSGTKSWSAFFFGSSDWGNYITVDKPAASLWIMGLSGRLFGFSSWSMLAPEALLGVASVALLFAAVRRVWGAPAGLLAGALLAITPAAALMFRFNNPDAALTFLLVAAAYTVTRAIDRASTRWLLLTAVLIGTAFLAKSLQALLVVPGMGLAYLFAAPAGWVKRAVQLVGAFVVMAVSGLWWPILVDSLPASSRPYVGGSTNNSVIELALGYNGLRRITGGGGPGGGGGSGGGGARPGGFGGGGAFGGTPGLDRLFNDQFAGFIAWLIPAALIGLLAAGWLTARARRADPRWGSIILWGGWTIVTAGVFSFMSGIVHSYYTVALAPGVAALAGMVVPSLWCRRRHLGARSWLAAMAGATVFTAYHLLAAAPTWLPWLRATVLVAGLAGAAALLLPGGPGRRQPAEGPTSGGAPGRAARRSWSLGRVSTVGAAVALSASVTGPLAWSLATIDSTHSGSIPTVGPSGVQNAGFGGGGPGGRFAGARERFQLPGGSFPNGGAFPNGGSFPNGGAFPNGGGQAAGGGQGAGGPGGLGGGSVDPALVSLLQQGAAGYRWVAATQSSMVAAPLQLSAGAPVMALGGFSGGDPAITLAQFQADVSAHRVHYYVGEGGFGGPGGGGPGGGGSIREIAGWVAATFTAKTVGGATVYDLSTPLSSSAG